MAHAMSGEQTATWVPADSFGARLVMIRRELKLTTEEIAERCNLIAPTWNTWENGVTPHKLNEVVKKIHDGVGVDRDWLMWGWSTSARLLHVPLRALPSMRDYRYASKPQPPLLAVLPPPEQ